MAKPKSSQTGPQPRGRQTKRTRGRKGVSSVAIWAVTGIAVVAVAALIIVATRPSSSSSPTTDAALAQGTTMGDPNAPISLVEYSDFQ